MRETLRALFLPALVALLATAALDLWIRGEPLAMPAALQVVLSLTLVGAVAMLLALAVREKRRGDETHR